MEPIGKLPHQYLGETKTKVEVPQKPNIPLDDDSTDPISKERVQEGRTLEDVESVIANIPRETPKRHNSTTYSEEGGSKSCPSPITVKQKLEDPSKPSLPNVIPSLYHESPQILTSSPPTLEILEIFQLVELKGGEGALLERALEKYPQLLLPRQQQIRGTVAFSYRVLVDILVVLATKTPCTITTSEKSTLENNLCGAALLGFDKSWIDSVRAKVFEVDVSVTSAQENIRVMEGKLETFGMRLKQVQKEKEEATRHLEVINSELSDLLKDHETLMTNMSKFGDIIRAKDTSYGI